MVKIQSKHKEEILKGSIQSLILKFFGIILNYLVIIVITKLIGVAAVGFYNVSFITLLLLTNLCSLGLNFSTTRFTAEYLKNEEKLNIFLKKSHKIIFTTGLLGGAVLFFLSQFIADRFFKNNQYSYAFKVLAFSIPFYVVYIFNVEYLRGLRKIIASESLKNLVLPIIILIFIRVSYYSLDNLTAIYGLIIASLIAFLLSNFNLTRIKNKKKGLLSTKTLIKQSSPLMIMGLAAFLLSESGIYILEMYHTNNEVGVYTIIYKVALVSSIIYTIMNTIVGPKIAELYWSNDIDNLKESIKYASKYLLLLSVVVTTILIFFSKQILLFFNIDYDSNTSMIILIIGQFIYAIFGVAGIFLLVTNHQKVFRNIYIISATVNMLLNFLLIPKYEVLGAAISLSVSYILLNIICTVYLFRKHKILAIYFPLINK